MDDYEEKDRERRRHDNTKMFALGIAAGWVFSGRPWTPKGVVDAAVQMAEEIEKRGIR